MPNSSERDFQFVPASAKGGMEALYQGIIQAYKPDNLSGYVNFSFGSRWDFDGPMKTVSIPFP
jgi:hypothetical protein